MNINNHKLSIEEADIDALENFKELIKNIHSLRNKKYGCPWQKEQTHETLIEYLIEESKEYIKTVIDKNKKNMKEELGDILFQIMLNAEIAQEKNEFELKDIIDGLNKKIKSRHPYVFQKSEKISIEEANRIWNRAKNEEKKSEQNFYKISNLESKLKYLTPEKGTATIANTCERLGFTWRDVGQIMDKIDEEMKELREAINIKNESNIYEEFGDVLFTIINLALFLDINHQDSLRSANIKFMKRFRFIEKTTGDRISKLSNNDFRKFWKLAKKNLKNIEDENSQNMD